MIIHGRASMADGPLAEKGVHTALRCALLNVMSPVAAPVDDLFDLDVELIDESAESDAETKARCYSSPSCCGIRSFRSIDLD
jgi:hypothetical protein